MLRAVNAFLLPSIATCICCSADCQDPTTERCTDLPCYCNSGDYCSFGQTCSEEQLMACTLARVRGYTDLAGNESKGNSTCAQCEAGQWSMLGASRCEDCEAGRWSDAGASECTLCEAGKFNEEPRETNASACQVCQAGSFSEAGSTTCSLCENGTYSQAGAAYCDVCMTGEWSFANASNCSACDAGKWSVAIGATTPDNCIDCMPGKFSLEGASLCTKCGPGNFSASFGSTACEVCGAGTYSESGADVCSLCEAGTWNDHNQSEVCQECPAGKWSATVGATNGTECELCGPGTWSATLGLPAAHLCTPCDAGKRSVAEGAVNSSTCESCESGWFASLPGSSQCEPCPFGSHSMSESSTCYPVAACDSLECPDGYTHRYNAAFLGCENLTCSSGDTDTCCIEALGAVNCTPVKVNPGWIVGISNHARIDYCFLGNIPGIDAQFDVCHDFCGSDGIPLVFGSSNFGFGLPNIIRAFSTIVDFNSSHARVCSEWARGFHDMEVRVANLLASLDNVRWAKQVYHEELNAESQNILTELQTHSFRRKMISATSKMRSDILRETLATRFSMLPWGRRFRDALSALKNASLELISSGAINNLDAFARDCVQFFPGVTEAGETLLDMCSAEGKPCIQEPDARHVACGCAVHSLAAMHQATNYSFTIPGSTTSENMDPQFSNGEQPFHICAEGASSSMDDIRTHRDVIATLAGSDVLDAHDAGLRYQHLGYYCNNSSLEAHVVTNDSVEEDANVSTVVVDPCRPFNILPFDGVAVPANLKAGSGTCQHIGIGWTEFIREAQQFCGPRALPLLLGSEGFGFNRTGIANVCLNPSVLRQDNVAPGACAAFASLIDQIGNSTASYMAAVEDFKYMRLRVKADLRLITRQLRMQLTSELFQRWFDFNATDEKMIVLTKLYKQAVAEPSLRLQETVGRVKQHADNLVNLVQNFVGGLDYYTNTCDSLHLGQGPQRQVILDICPLSSAECLNVDESVAHHVRHVAACCAVNLAVSGDNAGIPNIPGRGRIPTAFEPRVPPQLQPWLPGNPSNIAKEAPFMFPSTIKNAPTMTDNKIIVEDLCALANLRLRSTENSKDIIKDLGEENLIREYEDLLQARYPDYFARPLWCDGENISDDAINESAFGDNNTSNVSNLSNNTSNVSNWSNNTSNVSRLICNVVNGTSNNANGTSNNTTNNATLNCTLIFDDWLGTKWDALAEDEGITSSTATTATTTTTTSTTTTTQITAVTTPKKVTTRVTTSVSTETTSTTEGTTKVTTRKTPSTTVTISTTEVVYYVASAKSLLGWFSWRTIAICTIAIGSALPQPSLSC